MHPIHSRRAPVARLAAAVTLALALPLAAGAQNVMGIGTPPDNAARADFSLAVGASANLSVVAVSGVPISAVTTGQYTWASSDTSVVSLMMINPYVYMVTGKRDGMATISYTSSYGPASVRVTVGTGAPVTATAIPPRTVIGTIAPTSAPLATTTAARLSTAATTTARLGTTTTTSPRKLGIVTVAPPPRAAPTGFTGQYAGAGKVAFSWRSVPGAAGYLVTDLDRHAIVDSRSPTAVRAIFTDTVVVTTLPAGANTWHVAPVYLKPGETAIAADESNTELTELYSNTAAVTVPRWSGKYRVTLNGFKVLQETLDNPLEIDGKRDEVYFRSSAQEYDSLGNPVGASRDVKTRTYGDINHDDWTNPALPTFRIKAGSASALGGLMSGDGYPALSNPWVNNGTPGDRQLPLLLWEGWLVEDANAVIIAPAVWEDDAKPDPFGPERELVQAVGKYVTRRYGVMPQLASTGSLPSSILVRNKQAVTDAVVAAGKIEEKIKVGLGGLGITGLPQYSVGMTFAANAASALTSYASRMDQMLSLELNLKDRPIGMVPRASGNGLYDFAPVLLNLSYENVEGIINGGGLTGKGPGIIEVPYTDLTSNKGSYVLYVQVQRLP